MMKDLLLVLVLWINQHTGLQYHDLENLPHVEPVAQGVVSVSLLSRPVGLLVPWPERYALARHAHALYLPRRHVIQVSSNLDLSTAQGRSLLVRELAYMIQLQQGGGFGSTCENLLARNAMGVQNLFLQATSGSGLVLDEESLLRLSPCRM